MTEPKGFEQNSVEARLAMVEMALRPNGILFELAQAGLATPEGAASYDLTPTEAAEILLPTPHGELDPRFELLDNTKAAITEAANQRAEEILTFAEQLGMRQSETISNADIDQIDRQNAIWFVGGAANRTSVVRRQVAIDAMRRVYPVTISDQVLVQQASNRQIMRQRANGSENPEHIIAHEIAGDFLTHGEITEFSVSLASARQAGYEVFSRAQYGMFGRDETFYLTRPGDFPAIQIIHARAEDDPLDPSGLEAGLSVIKKTIEARGSDLFPLPQIVTATNGQYRAKEQRQVVRWAVNHDIELQPTVVLGDEAGYQVEHNGQTYTTAERKPMAYVLEAIVLSRMPINKR